MSSTKGDQSARTRKRSSKRHNPTRHDPRPRCGCQESAYLFRILLALMLLTSLHHGSATAPLPNSADHRVVWPELSLIVLLLGTDRFRWPRVPTRRRREEEIHRALE
jgi:hypothetical protein